MINSLSVDCEIFPNLFSITFVDLKDYLDKFKDCVDAKGNPKALTECLTVKEIKKFIVPLINLQRFFLSEVGTSSTLSGNKSKRSDFIRSADLREHSKCS